MEINLPKHFPQAMRNGVIIKEIEGEITTTKGGLLIPDVGTGEQGEKRKLRKGVIVSTGPEITKTVVDINTGKTRLLQKGDVVAFNPYLDSGFMFDMHFYIFGSELDCNVYLPDETTQLLKKEMPNRKRAAVAKEKMKLQ